MLKCHEVTALASDWLDDELTFAERMRVRVHLLMCRHCRHFVDGLASTRQTVNALIPDTIGVTTELETRIQAHLDQRLDHESGEGEPSRGQTSACNDASFQSPDHASDQRVQAVFANIREKEGYIPNLFRRYADNPEQLEQVWARVHSLMYGGRLSQTLKHTIAVLVSHDNGCDYCVVHHRRILRRLGVEPQSLKNPMATTQAEFLNQQENALLKLAREANRNPHNVPPQLLAEAHRHGADDSGVIEAMGVMELYAGFNRFLDTFQVPLEPELANDH